MALLLPIVKGIIKAIANYHSDRPTRLSSESIHITYDRGYMSDLSLTVFTFESEEICFVEGKPVANDVAKVLGYADPSKTISTKVDTENKGVAKMVTAGGMQSVTVLEEAGIYQLIFGSKLPSAKAFQKWVFSDVLPSIRKTGKYEVVTQPVIPSRVLALETARSVFDIKDLLADTDPRLCQLLVDVAINDAVTSLV